MPNFTYDSKALEVVQSFPYLGVHFNYNARFKVAQNELLTNANRALYSLVSKCRKLSLPTDIQIYLFNKLVTPVILYGSSIWGHMTVQLKYLKLILGLKSCTITVMARGEVGCYSLGIDIKINVLSVWFSLVNSRKEGNFTVDLSLYVTNVTKQYHQTPMVDVCYEHLG